MWPEGTQRCSGKKFCLWLGGIGIFLLWGAYGAFRILSTGLGVTALDNYFGFGLWITFDLAVIALGAGAFFTGFLRYILRLDQLKNIINLAVIVGFLCYSGAMVILWRQELESLRDLDDFARNQRAQVVVKDFFFLIR